MTLVHWVCTRAPGLATCVLILFLMAPLLATAASDEFIAGYASGVLEHEFGLTDATVAVQDGVVTVTAKTLAIVDQGKVTSALKQIPGVRSAQFVEADPAMTPPADGTVQATIPAPVSKWLAHGQLFSPL